MLVLCDRKPLVSVLVAVVVRLLCLLCVEGNPFSLVLLLSYAGGVGGSPGWFVFFDGFC